MDVAMFGLSLKVIFLVVVIVGIVLIALKNIEYKSGQ
jgi:hypothetical protein